MPQNQQYDSIQSPDWRLPYNRIIAELSEFPRLVRGLNTSVTLGGKLQKRPGTIEVEDDIGGTSSALRMDRCILYETQESPTKTYLLASFYNTVTELWGAYYYRPGISTGWTTMGTTRSLSASRAAQQIAVSRGLAYIKSYPESASTDKYGTAIFDGSGGSPNIRLWGLPAPTQAAAISGRVTILGANMDASTTAMTVDANFSPAVTPNFTIQVDYEQMTVTSVGGGTNWTVTRGVNGTTADTHDEGVLVLYRDWTASDHRVDVNMFWRYTYAWKSVTGQVSCRAPLETNPDKLPSSTGPFFDLIPKITLRGHADTTNIPTVVVYRTDDGGGTFYQLEEVANPGDSDFTYLDDSLESGAGGGTFNDPIPDDLLDQANIAPTLTSNTAPPTVLADDGVIGVDQPDLSSPIAFYNGRFWYAIGNTVFFSGNEEISEGVPEECWPSGLKGNFYRFQYPVTNLVATNNAVYVFTTGTVHIITGSDLQTFNPRILYNNIGAPVGNQRAVTAYGTKVAFLTQDYRIALIEGDDEPRIISDPLFTDLVDALNAGGQADLKYWGDLEKEWIVVSIHNEEQPGLSRHWIYDIKQSNATKLDFWNCPWALRTVTTYSGRIAEDSQQRRLCFYIWDPTLPYGRFVRIDPTNRTYRDVTVGTATSAGADTEGIDFSLDTHLHTVPPGNHVNTLRSPGLNPVVQYFVVERSLQPGDDDPQFYYYLDDFWSDPISAEFIDDPPRRNQSIAYKTMVIQVNDGAVHRFAFRVQRTNSTQPIELQNYTITYAPDSGTGGP